MENFQNNFMNSLAGGYQFGQQIKRQRDGNQLNQLASQLYGADTEQQNQLLSQAASVNAQAAQGLQKQVQDQQVFSQGQDDRRIQKLAGAARYLEQARQSGNPAAVQGAWDGVRPMLQREFPEGQFGETWDDATMAPTLYKTLAETGGGAQGNVQSVRVGDDGFYYNVMRDGRVVNTGIKSAPNIKVLEQEGQLPLGIVTSNGVAGSSVPIGGAPAASTGSPMTAGQGSTAALVNIEGIAPERQQQLANAVSALRAAGIAEDQIDAMVGNSVSQPRDVMPTQGNGIVRTPTAAERAASAEQAKIDVQLANADAASAAEAEAARRKKLAEGEATQIIDQADTARTNSTAARVYENGMNEIFNSMRETTTGPVAGRLPAVTSAQQRADGAIAAMAPVLKQMFRAAGEGAFTDKDQELLIAMLPTRTDTPEAREAKVANVDNIVRAKLNMPTPKVARNPQTGELLYLRFGQWVKK